MLATLNLQLTQADLGGESLSLQVFSPEDSSTDVGGFAALLNLRAGDQPQQPEFAGKILPAVGNTLPTPLPMPDFAITVDNQAVAAAEATPLPGADLLAALDQGEVSVEAVDEQFSPPVPAPLVVSTPLVASAPLGATPPEMIPGPVTPGPIAVDSSTGHPALQQRNALPETLQALRPDLVQQPTDAQVARSAKHSVALIPPGAVVDRPQATQRRIPEVVTGSESIDDVAQETRRPVVAAVAAPVVERLADMMRTRVRPTQSVAITQGQAQPAGFQQLATNTSLPDSSFSNTLQQQSTDLIRTPVMEPAWGDRIGERVVMLAGQQLKSAEIRLTPAELGPVRVQVSVEEGAANVTFHAQHAVTREALEQALPRLREMLAESGLSLAQADVGEHGVAEGNRDGDTDAPAAGLAGEDVDSPAGDINPGETRATVTANGLVDTFA